MTLTCYGTLEIVGVIIIIIKCDAMIDMILNGCNGL